MRVESFEQFSGHQGVVQGRGCRRCRCMQMVYATEYLVHEPLEGCAPLRSRNDILTNLKSPNGVVTAVLGMSVGATGIWW